MNKNSLNSQSQDVFITSDTITKACIPAIFSQIIDHFLMFENI